MNPHPSHLRRLIHQRPVLVLAVIGCMGIPSTAWGMAQEEPARIHVSKQQRLRELEHAQVFTARDRRQRPTP